MEFNLDFLRNAGEALSSFGKKDDDLIKVKGEEVKELSDKKDKDVATKTVLETTGDASVAEEINKDVISTLVLNSIQKKLKVVVVRYTS